MWTYTRLLQELADASAGLAVDNLATDGCAEQLVEDARREGLVTVFGSWAVDYVKITKKGRERLALHVQNRP